MELSTERKQLLGALFALCEAMQGKEYMSTAETELLIRNGLTADNAESVELLSRIRLEKDRFAPDCRICTHPCGRTAEFDVDTLYRAEPAVRETKLRLADRLRELAMNDVEISMLIDGIRIFGEDYPAAALKITVQRFLK